MNDFFESLEEHINDLQKSIDKMNESINKVNAEHESLKSGTQSSFDIELNENLNDQISEMTGCINEHMQNIEEMFAHLMDEDRLKYMSNMSALQNKMINRGK